MTRIITSTYRHKRPPRKKPKAAALEIPAVVTIRDKKRVRRSDDVPAVPPAVAEPEQSAAPANDDHKSAIVRNSESRDSKSADDIDIAAPSANDVRQSALVPARKPGKGYVDVPDLTPEEHKRRGDLTDAMFRDMKHRIAEELR